MGAPFLNGHDLCLPATTFSVPNGHNPTFEHMQLHILNLTTNVRLPPPCHHEYVVAPFTPATTPPFAGERNFCYGTRVQYHRRTRTWEAWQIQCSTGCEPAAHHPVAHHATRLVNEHVALPPGPFYSLVQPSSGFGEWNGPCAQLLTKAFGIACTLSREPCVYCWQGAAVKAASVMQSSGASQWALTGAHGRPLMCQDTQRETARKC